MVDEKKDYKALGASTCLKLAKTGMTAETVAANRKAAELIFASLFLPTVNDTDVLLFADGWADKVPTGAKKTSVCGSQASHLRKLVAVRANVKLTDDKTGFSNGSLQSEYRAQLKKEASPFELYVEAKAAFDRATRAVDAAKAEVDRLAPLAKASM